MARYASNHKADPAYVKESDETKYRWKDVQLVVYEWCLLEGVTKDEKLRQAIQDMRNGQAKVEVAYINITNNAQTTRLETWETFGLFREAGRNVIREAAKKLAAKDEKAYVQAVVSSEAEKYPLLPGLKKRKTTDYVVGTNFGKGR